MTLFCNLQLGLEEQTVYKVDKNETSRIARTNLTNLPDIMCGLYYNQGGTDIQISGPRDLCEGLVNDIYNVSIHEYSDKKPVKVHII